MLWVRNLLYAGVLALLSPWLVWKALRGGKYRRGWSAKIFGTGARLNNSRRRVWCHAVSVGEVNLLEPVLVRLRERFPDCDIVISTSTESGFDYARQKYRDHQVFFAPFDFTWAIHRVFDRLRPHLIILAELELWPNLLAIARNRKIPVVVINGRLSERSFRGYQRWKWFVGSAFQNISFVAAQTEAYAMRFRTLGVAAEIVRVTGNVKFDNVLPEKHRERANRLVDQFQIAEDAVVVVGGSTQPEENRLLIATYARLINDFPKLRLVLVPRHPQTASDLRQFLNSQNLKSAFRSEFTKGNALDLSDPHTIIVIDTIGELSAWWRRANLSYVGGSMGGRGGQNMIEPAACGAAISFGPHTENFRDVVELLLNGNAAVVVRNQSELEEFFRQALSDRAWADNMGMRARTIVTSQQGAADKTVALLGRILSEQAGSIFDTNRAA